MFPLLFVLVCIQLGCSDSGAVTAPTTTPEMGGNASSAGNSSSAGSAAVQGGGALAGSGAGGSATPSGAGSAGAATGGAGSGGGGGAILGGAPSAGAAGTDPGAPGSDLVPENGLLFGAYVDGGQLAAREVLLGRRLAIRHRFFAWTDNWIDADAQSDIAADRIPMATWEPFTGALTAIAAGQYDAMAHERAQAAKALGKPILLRFAHEMNGNWYPWGGANNGNDATGPQKYVAAWRHLHDLFVADGATNVLWVWCPNVDGAPDDAWNTPDAYYPGESYVDWVAVDGYNWGTSQTWSKWTVFPDILSPVYDSYAAMAKPMMIAETGSVEGGGDKAAWVTQLRESLKTTFPAIKAFVYFDTYDALNKTDWKFDTSQGAAQAFQAMAQDPYFNP